MSNERLQFEMEEAQHERMEQEYLAAVKVDTAPTWEQYVSEFLNADEVQQEGLWAQATTKEN